MNIYVYPDDIWEFATEHDDELDKKMIPIADDETTGAVLYVSAIGRIKYIVAEVNGEFVESEDFYGEVGGRKIITEYFKKYFDTESDYNNLMVIKEREVELDNAVFDFLDIITDGTYTDGLKSDCEQIKNMKEEFIDFLCKFSDVHIYRPMYVDDPDEDEEVYTDFPYDMYDFESAY